MPVTKVSKRRLGGTLTGAHSIFMLSAWIHSGEWPNVCEDDSSTTEQRNEIPMRS